MLTSGLVDGSTNDGFSNLKRQKFFGLNSNEVNIDNTVYYHWCPVLGDDVGVANTLSILSRCLHNIEFENLYISCEIIRTWTKYPDFNLATENDPAKYQELLSEDEWVLLKANISDRDLLLEAKAMFEGKNPWSDEKLGSLLSEHQVNLREHKRISTPKINRMIQAALDAGALGGKINGSGGGGCMFAYAPENPEKVVEAIEKVGGKAYIIEVDKGTTKIR